MSNELFLYKRSLGLKYCDGELYEQLMWDKSTVRVKLSLNPFTCMLNGYPMLKTFITQRKPYT